MQTSNQPMTLMGSVSDLDVERKSFRLDCRDGSRVLVLVSRETQFAHLKNLDELDRDRIHTPSSFNADEPEQRVKKYLRLGRLVVVQGLCGAGDDGVDLRCEARTVNLLHSWEGWIPLNDHKGVPDNDLDLELMDGGFLFEEGQWWITQIDRLGQTWLPWVFGDNQQYDFTRYRTGLGITGFPAKSDMQECATLSRLIYGLSSAYLLTGARRYLRAARAGVQYQREFFRSLSHDGKFILWSFGKSGTSIVVPSQSPDDQNTIPLYEQIYCLSGLAQYYRITQDWEVLEDIRRTMDAFDKFYKDEATDRMNPAQIEQMNIGRIGYGGYFSHLDYATLTCDTDALRQNAGRKNWNSIGDHIPAYLLNVLLALDPLHPQADSEFLERCWKMLVELAKLIVTHFPDPDDEVCYVHERFFRDWKPDVEWGWQRDRAIIGHNLKIAWNLCRVESALEHRAMRPGGVPCTEDYKELRQQMLDRAFKLGRSMETHGLDRLSGGCFDAVERQGPKKGIPVDLVWGATKDFWQQEQAVLAYLSLYGRGRDRPENRRYLDLARECMTFWNLFFLDHDNGGVFFRVGRDGSPDIHQPYGIKGGHAISGYHAFELNFLAHIYVRTFCRREPFCLYFRPAHTGPGRVLNVLPDFLPHQAVQISGVRVNGTKHSFNNDPFCWFFRF
jgi:mannose/cellobiose epimerase-like protein (N-acyl-D-glucosamine 2-epimerase family)